MKRAILVLRILASLALIAFLALSPGRLIEELGRDPYKEYLGGGNEERWSGVINVWHVVEFKTYQGSVTAYLEGIAAKYEKANHGVYVEISGLTSEAVVERLSRGERPDLWSTPLGYLQDVDFAPLAAVPSCVEGVDVYAREENPRALPYLMSGYFLLGNTALVQKLALTFPDAQAAEQLRAGDAAALTAVLQSAMDSPSTTRFGAVCAPPHMAARLGLKGALASEGDFKAGQVPFLIGDARACGDLARRMAKDGFTFDFLALGGLTDQVQYIGMDANITEERLPHAAALAELLLQEEQQQKLTALGAVPVIPLSGEPAYAEGAMRQLYEAYRYPLIPDPARYGTQRDALMDEAERAVAGDASAKTAFDTRMQELLKTKGGTNETTQEETQVQTE